MPVFRLRSGALKSRFPHHSTRSDRERGPSGWVVHSSQWQTTRLRPPGTPGGLTHLKHPEVSLVLSGFHRGEDIEFGTNPEGAGSHSVSEKHINYFSASYPFELFNYNMVVSLNYQHLYDFERDWAFTLKEDVPLILSSEEHWDYQQKGSLTAFGACLLHSDSAAIIGGNSCFSRSGDLYYQKRYKYGPGK